MRRNIVVKLSVPKISDASSARAIIRDGMVSPVSRKHVAKRQAMSHVWLTCCQC